MPQPNSEKIKRKRSKEPLFLTKKRKERKVLRAFINNNRDQFSTPKSDIKRVAVSLEDWQPLPSVSSKPLPKALAPFPPETAEEPTQRLNQELGEESGK
jgi:hypothetical protein